ncbi:hypothetical protein [Notoacmeibacter sp. MSK16QG-6]|uniref:hypothetical protein n=1 Tax=Notoacmeibacter sp. MSK16QG-6 TaxID=2957982 RepID=UPI00209D3AF1|nr:hypothetical protein [Notoacmeibacter sp. MSK16QG-6]MCP1200719.1 hypothetical protein [Notoacmeibacter sp. MSK16QG-6]
MIRAAVAVCCLFTGAVSAALAGDVEIIDVRYERNEVGRYTFHVALRHKDEGWDHYADKWQVLSPEGEVLGERVLLHPHVNEQPFTRSLSEVAIPSDVREVVIRAHDPVHGWSDDERRVLLETNR